MDIKIDQPAKHKYRNDWSTNFDSNPIAIVFPKNVEQVIDVIKLCNEFNYPLIGSGGRTGLSGGASALSNELIVSFEKMNAVLDYDEISQTVLCEAGLITQNLQSFADENLYYPVDFSSSGSSQIGGNIATNAGGIRVIKYGLTSQYVAGINVVTGSGEIFSQDDMLIKNATGPDLKNLFIGSEGCYGLTTSCRIRLLKKPEETNVFLIGFSNLSSLEKITKTILRFDIEAIEFFTRNSLNQVKKEFDHVEADFLDSNYYIIVEQIINEKFSNVLEKIYLDGDVEEIIISTNENKKKLIWQYRMLISESITRYFPIKFDVAVPPKNIPKLIYNLELFFKSRSSYSLILFGHLGDGNLHINILKKEHNKSRKDIFNLEQEIYSIVLNLDGTLSAEHGVGANKIEAFMNYGDKTKIELMQALKNYFDQNNILNPGKLIKSKNK